MFYYVMKGIQRSVANFLSYISTKYYQNWSTSDLVMVKTKRVNFFETQCIYDYIAEFNAVYHNRPLQAYICNFLCMLVRPIGHSRRPIA